MRTTYSEPETESEFIDAEYEQEGLDLARAALYAISDDELREIRCGSVPARVTRRMERDAPRHEPVRDARRIPHHRTLPRRGGPCWDRGCVGTVTSAEVAPDGGAARTTCSRGHSRRWVRFEALGWVAQSTMEEIYS